MKKMMTALLFVGVSTLSIAQEGIPSGRELQAKVEQKTKMINTADLKKMIDESPDLVLVDIRTKSEIQKMGGAIEVPQNINIPRGWLEFSIQSKTQGKETPIVVYCGGGLRSPFAAETLQQMGYTNVWNYSEGYMAWKRTMMK